KLFAQAGVTHTAHSFTQSGSNPVLSAGANISTNQLRFENPEYTEYDASFGVGKDAWTAEIYGLNITNVITSAFTSDAQFTLQETITRPRVLGLRVGYRFQHRRGPWPAVRAALLSADPWESGARLPLLERFIVPDVLLSCVDPRLIVPGCLAPEAQCGVDLTPSPLTREHLLVQ